MQQQHRQAAPVATATVPQVESDLRFLLSRLDLGQSCGNKSKLSSSNSVAEQKLHKYIHCAQGRRYVSVVVHASRVPPHPAQVLAETCFRRKIVEQHQLRFCAHFVLHSNIHDQITAFRGPASVTVTMAAHKAEVGLIHGQLPDFLFRQAPHCNQFQVGSKPSIIPSVICHLYAGWFYTPCRKTAFPQAGPRGDVLTSGCAEKYFVLRRMWLPVSAGHSEGVPHRWTDVGKLSRGQGRVPASPGS